MLCTVTDEVSPVLQVPTSTLFMHTHQCKQVRCCCNEIVITTDVQYICIMVLSFTSLIALNSSIQHRPRSASTSAPASSAQSLPSYGAYNCQNVRHTSTTETRQQQTTAARTLALSALSQQSLMACTLEVLLCKAALALSSSLLLLY
jgi:hypothetical protein